MKQIITSFRILSAIGLLAVAAGCASTQSKGKHARCRGL